MCGICGKFTFDGAIVEKALIAKMCDTIRHRGPDDEGIYTAPFIGLGQRRLSIIDLRKSAAPPLSNENNSIWIVFNGEIYNFKNLRQTLLDKGHAFRTETDTEIIIHLYEEYGIDCLNYLRGMFAFAIWDSNKKRLFAARDRLGKKPFIYTKTPSAFIFGSEIKAISADPEVVSSPNFAAIDSYLTYQYVPSPLTAFSGILKLPPAHYLLCGENGIIKVDRYWSPPLAEKSKASREEISNELFIKLREAVRLRLVSDVPVGAFLSGGVDSATIVALMAMESSTPVKTFSIGFDEEKFSELPYAKLIAQRYGTQHHEFIVKPSAIEVLPLLVRHYNEPFADASAIPSYYVSKYTRQHVTVALSGDGGDESFAGYSHYNQALYWEKFDVIPLPVRKSVDATIRVVLGRLPYLNGTARIERALQMICRNLPDRYRLQMSMFKPQEKQWCYTPMMHELLRNDKDQYFGADWDQDMDSLDWMMRHDLSHYLPECLSVKTDISSMANSLELRSPLLDHELIEFAASIPSNLKWQQNSGKIIFKEAFKKLLPQEILTKPKTGFGIPLAKWFRGELLGFLKEILLSEQARRRGLFKDKVVSRMIDEHAQGKRDWSNRLWALLFLELWFCEFIDSKPCL